MLKKTLIATAITLTIAGGAATNASAAFDLTGGDYIGATNGVGHTFTIDEFQTIECADVSFSGNTENVPNDPASTVLTPTFSDCNFFGFPVVATTPDPWKLTVSSGPDGSGYHDATLGTPGDTLVEFYVPILGCTVTYEMPNPGYLNSSRLRAAGNETAWEASLMNLPWEADNCFISGTGTNGTFSTNGAVTFPGVDIAEL